MAFSLRTTNDTVIASRDCGVAIQAQAARERPTVNITRRIDAESKHPSDHAQ